MKMQLMKTAGVALSLLILAGCSTGGSTGTVRMGEDSLMLRVLYSPEYFSPDGDANDDKLTIHLTVDGGDITAWTFDIMQPTISVREGQEAQVFKHFEGNGTLPIMPIVWDGSGDTRSITLRNPAPGEAQTREYTPLVQSATAYPYRFSVTDTNGNVSEPVTGIIYTDVMVRVMEDGRLRISVPSIMFRPDAADFEGLNARIIANNNYVIQRIATTLNKFNTYRIVIEGHANPVNAPGTQARAEEEIIENALGSLSEQRANAVLELLVKDGVSRNRMTTIGKGISEPVVDFDNQDAAWRNRRVEFYLQQ